MLTDQPQTLPRLFARAAECYGDAPAIAANAGVTSYRDLSAAVARLANGLLAQGVSKATRVALLAGNTRFFIEALLAITGVGAVAAPISTLAAPAELAHILRHSDAHMLLVARHYAGRDYSEILSRALPALMDTSTPRALRLRDAPYLRSIWIDDVDGLPWANAAADLAARAETDPLLDAALLMALQSEVAASDDAVIIYTSGSTAEPKAVIHTHGPMARQIRTLAEAQLANPCERVLCMLPMFWVGGMTMLLEVLDRGGCIVLPDGATPQAYADAIRDIGVDLLHGWPAQQRAVRQIVEREGTDFSGVRNLRDERLPNGDPKLPGFAPNSLGMTESFGPHGILPFSTLLPPHQRGAYAPASGGFERRVVDSETGAPLSVGQKGELQLRGGALMRGYYKRELATTFTPDGFFPTQDLVRIEADGFMHFQGRTGDMLKTKGANVSRLEVESALRKIPGVMEAIVCGLPDVEAGQIIVAAVTPVEGYELDEAGLTGALRDHLAAYKIPRRIAILPAGDLLWTATGKVRLAAMAARIAEQLCIATEEVVSQI